MQLIKENFMMGIHTDMGLCILQMDHIFMAVFNMEMPTEMVFIFTQVGQSMRVGLKNRSFMGTEYWNIYMSLWMEKGKDKGKDSVEVE